MTALMEIDRNIFDNYPIEIFDRIAYYLTSKQNGICRSVCHSWNKLFTPSQYIHVQIRGKRQFKQIHEALQNVGHYVKRLTVEDVDMESHELESLPILCPNLVAFSFNGKSIDTTNTFAEWKHLRRLTELQDLSVTNYFLSAHTLSSLTHLSIRFNPQQNKHAFFDSLSKATELTSLSLDSVSLSFAEIESIHQSCPYLQKLRLINATLEPIASSVQEKRAVATWALEPARFVTTFEYENGHDLYDSYEWLYYISCKYSNLQNLELWCAYSIYTPPERNDDDLQERYGALARIGLKCPLKSLKMLNIAMNGWIFETLDHAGTQLEHVGLSDMTDNTIDMLQYLGESQQNVSSLTLWGWPTLCIQETMEETISMLGQCSNRLSSLTLSMQFSGITNAPVPLDLLLNRCANLASLTLDSAQPFISSVNTDHQIRPKLTRLVLDHGSFRNSLFEYVSMRCPHLQELEIESCALIASSGKLEFQIKIHMPQHRFQRISVNHVRPPSNYHHAKVASDIRFFHVTTTQWHQLFELTSFEPYSPSLTFQYEQKPKETERPTKYVCHDTMNDACISSLVSVECQQLNELNIGSFWVH